jgi:hypothetical protein
MVSSLGGARMGGGPGRGSLQQQKQHRQNHTAQNRTQAAVDACRMAHMCGSGCSQLTASSLSSSPALRLSCWCCPTAPLGMCCCVPHVLHKATRRDRHCQGAGYCGYPQDITHAHSGEPTTHTIQPSAPASTTTRPSQSPPCPPPPEAAPGWWPPPVTWRLLPPAPVPAAAALTPPVPAAAAAALTTAVGGAGQQCRQSREVRDSVQWVSLTWHFCVSAQCTRLSACMCTANPAFDRCVPS